MDLEEIEEVYRRELEEIEKEFLKAIADKKNAKGAENTYKSKIKAARDRYYKLINDNLEKEKKNYGRKGRKKEGFDVKPFKVEPGNFELSWWQKKKLEWNLWFFKKHFHTRNKVREKTPKFVSYHYYKWRLLLKRFYGNVREGLSRAYSGLVSMLQHNYGRLKDLVKKILKYLSGVPEKVVKLIQRIRGKKVEKKAGEGDKKEEKKEEKKSS